MLRFFAKFQRSRNALLLLFCAVLLIGLIAFYIPSTDMFGSRRNLGSNSEDTRVVAKVGGYEVTAWEYRRQLMELAQMYGRGNALPMATVKGLGLDSQALSKLIEDRMILAEADRLGLAATDSEVNDQIRRLPTFANPETGQFIGAEEYKRQLALRGEKLEAFERHVRYQIAVEKVRSYLTSAEQMSEQEMEGIYKKDNTKVDLVYAVIDNEKVRKRLQLTDADLQAYYDAHKDDFKATEPVRKVDYLFIPTDEVAKSLTISDADLRAEYEKNKQIEPRVSVIKLNVLSSKDEGTVKAKADELAQRLRGSESVKAENFAEVARGNSMDPSASKGGDLGFIKKDANHPNDWKQRAYSLKVNDIDGPFRDGQSWYIIKMIEQRDVPFEQMRPTLLAGARNRRAYQMASQLADKAYEKFTETKDIHKAAEEMAKELKVKPEALIRSTPFFKNGDTLPEIGSNQQFELAVAQLKKGEIGDKVGIPNGLAVPQLVDLREGGQQLSFEEARNQVQEKVRREREQNLAQQRAQEILKEAKDAADFERLARAEGLEIKNDTNFNTYSFPTIQATQLARSVALDLKEGEVAKVPIKVGVSYLIFAATKRTEPDLTKLATERDSIRQRVLGDRQSQVYDAYIRTARQRYDKDGKVKIYQDRIDAVMSDVVQPGPGK